MTVRHQIGTVKFKQVLMNSRKTGGQVFRGLNPLARMMDTQFRIPGTQYVSVLTHWIF